MTIPSNLLVSSSNFDNALTFELLVKLNSTVLEKVFYPGISDSNATSYYNNSNLIAGSLGTSGISYNSMYTIPPTNSISAGFLIGTGILIVTTTFPCTVLIGSNSFNVNSLLITEVSSFVPLPFSLSAGPLTAFVEVFTSIEVTGVGASPITSTDVLGLAILGQAILGQP